MKIAVFSDSHGDAGSIEKILAVEKPDIVLHLGDHASDLSRAAMPKSVKSAFTVSGNCDFGGPPERLVTLRDAADASGKEASFLILMMHGHTAGVKSGTARAVEKARAAGADALFFGHTHVPLLEYSRGLLVLNPGSSKKRFPPDERTAAYGLITLENGVLKPDIKPVP
jgi:putative phosphoesterase